MKLMKIVYNDLEIIDRGLEHLASKDQWTKILKIICDPSMGGVKPWTSCCVISKIWVDKMITSSWVISETWNYNCHNH